MPRREREQDTRSLLIHSAAFEQLRQFQHRASAPRLDMRYLVEGAIAMLARSSDEMRWIASSRECLVHALGRPGLRETADAACCVSEGSAHVVDRAHGAPAGANAKHPDCRSLLVGLVAFERLKAIQGNTREPRLEMRYLVEGAIALLTGDVTRHGDWIRQSRHALQGHLTHLLSMNEEPS